MAGMMRSRQNVKYHSGGSFLLVVNMSTWKYPIFKETLNGNNFMHIADWITECRNLVVREKYDTDEQYMEEVAAFCEEWQRHYEEQADAYESEEFQKALVYITFRDRSILAIKYGSTEKHKVDISTYSKVLDIPFERRDVIKKIGEEFQKYYGDLLNIFEDSNSAYKANLDDLIFKERFHEQELLVDAYMEGGRITAETFEDFVAFCRKMREQRSYFILLSSELKKKSAYAALETFGVGRTVYSDFVSYNNCEKEYDKKMFVNLSFALGLSYNLAERLMNLNGYTLNSRGRTFDKMCSMALRCGFSRDMTIALIDKENAVLAKKFSPFTPIPNLTKNTKKN